MNRYAIKDAYNSTNNNTIRMSKAFSKVAIGERFELNGNKFIKRSTRTALIISECGRGRIFYIPQLAPCIVAG